MSVLMIAAACSFALGILFYMSPKSVILALVLFAGVTFFGFDMLMAVLKDLGVSREIIKAKDFSAIPIELLQGVAASLGCLIAGVGLAAFYKNKIYSPKVETGKELKSRILEEYKGYNIDVI